MSIYRNWNGADSETEVRIETYRWIVLFGAALLVQQTVIVLFLLSYTLLCIRKNLRLSISRNNEIGNVGSNSEAHIRKVAGRLVSRAI